MYTYAHVHRYAKYKLEKAIHVNVMSVKLPALLMKSR